MCARFYDTGFLWIKAVSCHCVTYWQWWTERLCRWPSAVQRTFCVCTVFIIIIIGMNLIITVCLGRNSSVGSAWARCHSVAGSILLWGHFPVEGIFPLELTWVQTPFPQNSFGWEYKPRSSLCTHAFHRTDSKDPDVHVLDGWMPATKTHPACTIHEDGMWLP